MKTFSSRDIKEKVGKEPLTNALFMNNLEKLLAATLDKASGNASGDIVERFIKTRASTIFGHPEHSLDRQGQLIAVSIPHEAFFNSTFGIWIGGKHFQMDDADQLGCKKYGGPYD